MKRTIRTDLALEAREFITESGAEPEKLDGVKVEEESDGDNIKITRITIENENGVKKLNKKQGSYITVEFPADFSGDSNLSERLIYACAKEIKNLFCDNPPKTTLVIGLGNWNITADALGPKVTGEVLVTRHLAKYMPDEIDSRLSSVSAVAPGVLGITGIETQEIVKGIVERVKPDLIIAIDALCSRKIDRINSTIQISDTGIVPGAGVGNRRMSISEESLGVPVIAVGVPTVVDAATIAGDTIEIIVNNLEEHAKNNEPLYKMLSVIEEEDKMPIIKEALSPAIGDFIVTPKEIDEAITRLSVIIGDSINLSLHKGLELSEVEIYKN